MMHKTYKIDWNPDTWVFAWKLSMGAIQWMPTWHFLDAFSFVVSLFVDQISLSIGRVKSSFEKGRVVGPVLGWTRRSSHHRTLLCRVLGIKIRRWTLVQIYSRDVGVCSHKHPRRGYKSAKTTQKSCFLMIAEPWFGPGSGQWAWIWSQLTAMNRDHFEATETASHWS